jgi:hypothetical protein
MDSIAPPAVDEKLSPRYTSCTAVFLWRLANGLCKSNGHSGYKSKGLPLGEILNRDSPSLIGKNDSVSARIVRH